jgi:hypothetical protein
VREAYRRLVEQGWTDALRALHPDERIYTFWKYFRNAFARNAGLRIDHFLLSPSIADRLVAAGVDRDVRGRERASDHAPVWIELADAKADRPRRARRLNRGIDHQQPRSAARQASLVRGSKKRDHRAIRGHGGVISRTVGAIPVRLGTI